MNANGSTTFERPATAAGTTGASPYFTRLAARVQAGPALKPARVSPVLAPDAADLADRSSLPIPGPAPVSTAGAWAHGPASGTAPATHSPAVAEPVPASVPVPPPGVPAHATPGGARPTRTQLGGPSHSSTRAPVSSSATTPEVEQVDVLASTPGGLRMPPGTTKPMSPGAGAPPTHTGVDRASMALADAPTRGLAASASAPPPEAPTPTALAAPAMRAGSTASNPGPAKAAGAVPVGDWGTLSHGTARHAAAHPDRPTGPAAAELHIGRIQLNVRQAPAPARPPARVEARPEARAASEPDAFSSHRHYLRGL